MAAPSLTEILHRVIGADGDEFDPQAARAFLRLKFGQSDMTRMEELGELAQEGRLTPEERAEYEGYLHVGHLLALLHAKARRSLQRVGAR